MRVDFKAVGTGNSSSAIILGGGGSSTKATAAAAAVCWKNTIDAPLGYARVVRPLIDDAARFRAATNCNAFYSVLRQLDAVNGLDFVIPLAFVRRQTAVVDTLKVCACDVTCGGTW